MRNLSYENEFCMQFHFHANQSHFHKNGFALRLALKQRHKGTRKRPISLSCLLADLGGKGGGYFSIVRHVLDFSIAVLYSQSFFYRKYSFNYQIYVSVEF